MMGLPTASLQLVVQGLQHPDAAGRRGSRQFGHDRPDFAAMETEVAQHTFVEVVQRDEGGSRAPPLLVARIRAERE